MNSGISPEKLVEFIKKYKVILVCTGSIFVSFIILSLVITPQVLSYFSSQSQIEDLRKKTADLQSKTAQLEGTDPNVLMQGLNTIAAILPESPEIPDAMVAIQEKALSSNLKVESISFLSNSTQSKNHSFGLEIRVSGPLVNLRAFLINLSSVPRIAEVETITMQKKDANVEATIPIQVYYRKVVTSVKNGSVGLTQEQQKLLNQLSKLVPTNTDQLPAVIDTSGIRLGRPDPFE